MEKIKNEELNRLTLEGFKNSEKIPVIIVLDNVRSQHNIGSVFRTADAFRIMKIHLCGITATPPSRDITKSALGATESVDWEYFENTLDSVESLKKAGYTVIAVEQAKESIFLDSFIFDSNEKIALIFGNEVEGVKQEVMNKVDKCIEIPQFGTKHSFNISVSVAIVLWEAAKVYKLDK